MLAFKKSRLFDAKNIVLLRALQLGDLLNAVPAFRALRAAFPSASITLVGLEWSQEFVRRFHSCVDHFVSFPGFPGLPEKTPDLATLPAFLEQMQTRNFDLAIQMHGSGEIVNPLIGLFGAKQSAGFYVEGQYCPDKDYFLEYPQAEPEIWKHLRLMEFLGIPLQGDELEFPLFDEDWKAFNQIKQDFNLQSEYVCIHPGARKSERRWPVQKFAAVADVLAGLGFQIVLTGTTDEAHLTLEVMQEMKTQAINLAGKTSLGTLAALLSEARLVISNDTGISHMASAVKAPSVILFSVPDMDRWAPKNRQLHRVLWPAMKLTPEDVLVVALSHLREVNAHDRLEPLHQRISITNEYKGVKS
jgi:ADP-heptose:LPS heptosyltransferase